MTLTGHFLDGFGHVKVVSHSQVPFWDAGCFKSAVVAVAVTVKNNGDLKFFWIPPSADKADDDHGGSSSSLGDADKADDDHGGSSSSLGDADKADDDHGGSSSSLGDADESTLAPHHHLIILIIILRQRWPQIALGSGLRQLERLQPGLGQRQRPSCP